jgi:hypothetical protein
MDLTLGTSGRAHEPGSDGMPEPPGFMEEMSRGMGDSASGAENISSDGAEPDGSGDNTDEGGETVSGEHDGLPSTPSDPNLSAAPESDAVASRGQRLLRQAVILRFRAEQESAIRGQTLVCEVSLLEADDRPIVGKKVSVFIAAVGVARPERGTKICEGLTDENGRFRQSCPIPATQEMGRWNVFGYFAGDEERTDAVAE